MSICMAIHSYPKANDGLKRHWPYFKRAEADENIIITTTDGGCWVPDDARSIMIGSDMYISNTHLPMRLIRTYEHMLRHTKHDFLVVAEWDCIFFRPIPRDLPTGLTGNMAGGKPQGCRCNFFIHPIWACDRNTAELIVKTGKEIINEGISDSSPDCHMGQVVERAGIPFNKDTLSYSRNTVDNPVWAEEARQAVKNGALWVHGIKHADILEAVTKP